MASTPQQDKRIVERALRRGEATPKIDAAAMPDLAGDARPTDEAEVAQLREELEAEQIARTERIARFIEEGPIREEKPEPVLIDESDL